MSNRILSKRHIEDDNNYLSKKLNTMKSIIKDSIPVTFEQKLPKQGKVESFKSFLKRQDDYFLFRKLEDIYASKQRNLTKQPYLKLMKNHESYRKKLEIINIANQNSYLLRKIKDSKPAYQNNLFEKDFAQSQRYVKNICSQNILDPTIKKYTSIDFYKERVFDKTICSFNSVSNRTTKNKTANNFFTPNVINNSIQSNSESKVLYSRKVYIDKLGCADILFIIEDNKFNIHINPLDDDFDSAYTIQLQNIENSEMIQSIYSNYEQIISSIVYDGSKIKFRNRKRSLVYVRYIYINILLKNVIISKKQGISTKPKLIDK